MTGPEVRCFKLAGCSAYVRAEVCEARYPHNTLALTLEGDEDVQVLSRHYLPVSLVAQLGAAFADLAVWLGERGYSVATDVRADTERQMRLLRQAEAREFRNDSEDAW